MPGTVLAYASVLILIRKDTARKLSSEFNWQYFIVCQEEFIKLPDQTGADERMGNQCRFNKCFAFEKGRRGTSLSVGKVEISPLPNSSKGRAFGRSPGTAGAVEDKGALPQLWGSPGCCSELSALSARASRGTGAMCCSRAKLCLWLRSAFFCLGVTWGLQNSPAWLHALGCCLAAPLQRGNVTHREQECR